MKKKTCRLCIYPKDVQLITGRSIAYSRTLLKNIKQSLGKDKNALVSIEEFCIYTGISMELVQSVMAD